MIIRVLRQLLTVIFVISCVVIASTNTATAMNQLKFTVALSEVNPVTGIASGDPDATGTAVLKFYPQRELLCYKIKLSGLQAPTEPGPGVGNAHIHRIADGSIAVDLETEFLQAGEFYIATGCVSVSAAQIADIIEDPSAYYLNIHNAPYPGGALFGTL